MFSLVVLVTSKVIKRRVDSQIVAVHIVLSRVDHATVNLRYRDGKIFDPRINYNVYDIHINMYEHDYKLLIH